MDKKDTKHLYRKTGRNIWTIRYVVPLDVLHAFLDENNKPRKEITKSTGSDDLYTAQQLRDIFIAKMKLRIQAIRTGDESLIPKLAEEYKIELQNIKDQEEEFEIKYIKGEVAYDVGLDTYQDIKDELVDEATDRIKELKLINASQEDINKERLKGKISEEQALEKLDKTGKVKEFYNEILGKNFDAHLDHWETRRSLKVNPLYMQAGIAHVKLFQEYHPTIAGVTWRVVEEWVHQLGNPKTGKPKNSITIGGYLSSLRSYWKHVSKIIEDPNAKDIHAFNDHTMPVSIHNVRAGWESEDLRKLYEEETITSKNTPLLKPLMLIAMFTGCRIEDACRLQRKDVINIKGIRCLHIDSSKAKRFHNFGKRNTPIHSKLEPTIDKLLSEIDEDPEAYLITIKTAIVRGKRSTALSKSFGAHKEYLGYEKKDPNTERNQVLRDFHSIRTTGNSFLKNKKVEQTEREVIFGWSKSFKNASMAENNYNDKEISYPYDQRKKDIELLSELYYWLD